jgi:hypothetical protein
MSLSFFTGPLLVILKQVQDDDAEVQDDDEEVQGSDEEVQDDDNPLFRHPELVSG